jgi:hypothetical protein
MEHFLIDDMDTQTKQRRFHLTSDSQSCLNALPLMSGSTKVVPDSENGVVSVEDASSGGIRFSGTVLYAGGG